jgi:hypothetical protein
MVYKNKNKVFCDVCGKITIELDRLPGKVKKFRNPDKWSICFDCLLAKKRSELCIR